MKNKKVTLILAVILLLAMLLIGCGGRQINVDTGAFHKPTETSIGTTDGELGNTFDGATHGVTESLESLPGDQGDVQDLAQLLASGVVVEYDRAVLNDPLLGCEVARTLMPKGWIAGGEVAWNGQSGMYPAVFHFCVGDPNNEAVVGSVSGMSFVEPDPVNSWDAWAYGQIMPGSLAQAKALLSPGEYNVELLSALFPTQNVKTLETKYPEGKDAQVLEEVARQRQQETDELNAQTNSYGNIFTSSQCSVRAEESTLTFDMNGTRWKASVYSAQTLTITTTQDKGPYPLPAQTYTMWEVPVLIYYMAQENVYEQYEQQAASIFFGNYIRNQQWENALMEACRQAYANEANRQTEQWQQIQQTIQQNAAALAASSQQNYSSSGGLSGYDTDVMGGWTNAITGNSYYEGPDGGHMLLDSNQYHYTNGSSVYSSSDPLNIGGTNLSPLTDLGTMGGD